MDERGKGVERVRIVLEEEEGIRSKGGRDSFHAITDSKGEFLVQGIPTGGVLGTLKISLKKEGYQDVSGRIEPGAAGLSFRMRRLPMVSGMVQVDPGIPLRHLSVRGFGEGGKETRSLLREEGPGRGTYLLHLPFRGPWKIAVCARKGVLAGKEIDLDWGRERRIDFDLRGKVGLYRLKARNGRGGLVYAFWVVLEGPKGDPMRYLPVEVDLEDLGVKVFLLPKGARILKVESKDKEVLDPYFREGRGVTNLVTLLSKGDGGKRR